MKTIPQIIVRAYLRRWPVHLRKSQFNVLARYSWLKAPLQDIKAELFPQTVEETSLDTEALETQSGRIQALENASIDEILNSEGIQGQKSLYHIESWLGKRGHGDIFEGFDGVSKQPVIIKYYERSSILLSQAEFLAYQQNFQTLLGLRLPDNQPHEDLRVNWPIDAVKDSHNEDRVFVITPHQNYGPTMRQWLERQPKPLAPTKVRVIIGQILQSLMHLHHQPIRMVSDQRQVGLAHGNLSLDSVSWVDRSGEDFFYLNDLAIWERLFQQSSSASSNISTPELFTLDSKRQDLVDLALLGFNLLQAGDITEPDRLQSDVPNDDSALIEFLGQLKHRKFQHSDAAWQAWLRLQPLAMRDAFTLYQPPAIAQKPNSNPWRLIAGGALLALMAFVGGWWLMRSRFSEIASLPCCLDQVERVPEGEFTYATINKGSWERALGKANLLGVENLAISNSIETVHKSFNLTNQDVETIEEAINLVNDGKVDFAVIPLIDNVNLPAELGYEIIAYDGLTVFVPFSYDPRRGGIPKELKGQMPLEDIQNLYTRELSRNDPFSSLFQSENKEDLQVFQKEVLAGDESLVEAFNEAVHETKPAAEMLRTMLANFEGNDQSSLGFATLSHVMKQCSIYPLAISVAGKDAVQPMVMRDGEAISPKTNLCDDKSLYQPNVDVFKRNDYPLAFPIAVIFPRDNSQPVAGQKFAEMMRTLEGQQLLLEANLVPVLDPFELAKGDMTQFVSYLQNNQEEDDSSRQQLDRDERAYKPIPGRRLRSASATRASLQTVETSGKFMLSPTSPSQEAIDFEAIGETFLPEPPANSQTMDAAEEGITEATTADESLSNNNNEGM